MTIQLKLVLRQTAHVNEQNKGKYFEKLGNSERDNTVQARILDCEIFQKNVTVRMEILAVRTSKYTFDFCF